MPSSPLIIVGLGNPGKKYENTRHNAGFLLLDEIATQLNTGGFREDKKFSAEIAQGQMRNSRKVILAKPTTFMNDSGKALRALCDYYKVDPTTDIIIAHDDLDIPLGEFRDVQNRGPAGQNGVIDIIQKLGTKDFRRIRIGIDNRTDSQRQNITGSNYVLSRFTREENATLCTIISDIIIQTDV